MTGKKVRARSIPCSFRRRLALSTALASVAFVGYGRAAYAGNCNLNAGTYECSGAAGVDITQTLSGSPLNVTTDPGFGINTTTNGGDAFTLTGTGGLTFTDNNNAAITGQDYGIYADNLTSGALSITTTGQVTGNTYDGINAFNDYGTSSLTISANGVSGEGFGISALNVGDGALSVTATGQVIGSTYDGISAVNSPYGTDLTVSAAAVSGEIYGIYAVKFGTGALSVTATGQVTGATDDGILAVNNYGTSLTVSAAAVTGDYHGIHADNFGDEALSVTATGQVTGTNSDGIVAYNSGYGSNLTVVATAVSGGDDGIDAENLGDGFLSITATGLVEGDDDGIDAENDGTSLTISAAAVTGTEYGIIATNYGSGALSITATGQVTGIENDGIDAENDGTSLTIIAAGVSGEEDGINADNYGNGVLSVTATGLVTGATEEGIDAYNSASGTSLTVSAHDVSGGVDAILAENLGDGILSVTVDGAVSGGTGSGINTQTGLGGETVITLNSGADVSATSGIAISNDAGDSDTTVNTGASATGAIQLGNGSDNLTFDGGNFSGVTSFDGGDDTSAADGFVDRLAFKNVSGSVAGANVINWENVVVDMNGTITFNDNALAAGRLDAVNGGEVSMETGAAENFQLTGDLGLASGGSLVLEIFSASDFDTFDIDGLADFGAGGEIDFLFDAGFDPFDGLELIFLTALDGIGGFDLLDFNFIGLDPLFRATVGLGPQEDELFLSFSRRVPEPGTLALFGAGLLGLFGLGRVRRRYTAT